MRFFFLAALAVLVACSPELNWREVRVDPTALTVLLPCKPDRGARVVPLAGRDTPLNMLGCDAGGATFAVAFADTTDAGQAAAVLTQWRAATLANMRAQAPAEQAFTVAGGVVSVRVAASGRRADGKPVQSQAVYFSQGPRVYQAVMYADKLQPDVADTFFAGLRLP
jgi:hypothetical protein